MTRSVEDKMPGTYSDVVSGTRIGFPATEGEMPVDMERRHSRNLFWAVRSWVCEVVRWVTSSSSCFLTWESCGVVREERSTAGGRG